MTLLTEELSWPKASIGSLLDVVIDYRGKTPPKSEFGIPTLTAGNIKGGRVDLGSTSYVSEETYQKWITRGLIKPGDVLITTEAPVGEVAILPDDQTYLITRRIMALRPKPQLLDNRYLYYSLRYPVNLNCLLSSVRGSTVPRVLKPDILNLEISLPSLDEQKSISAVLSAFDDKIELNRRMNATLEEMARAIFKSWFVDFDPVHARARGEQPYGMDAETAALFPDRFDVVDGREVPVGWRVSTLRNEIELAYGKSLTAKKRVPGQYPVYGSNGPVGTHSEKLVDGPGIVVGRKGNPGTVNWSEKSFFPIDTTFYVTLKNPDHSLLFWFFALEQQNLRALSADSAVPGLNRNIAYMNSVVLPDRELMYRFEEAVQPMFAKVEINSEESSTLARIRDTLLPRLMSGQLRISEEANYESVR